MSNLKALPRIERRSADYSLLKVLDAFEPAEFRLIEGTCGNIQSAFNPVIDYSKPEAERDGGLFDGKYFFEMVSAPMLLARLCAGFKGLKIEVDGQEAYKVTWTIVLRHKKSKNLITFYDWKGSASFGSNIQDPKGTFKNDVAKLLKTLANDAFPHPYDGCRVGEIA